MAFAGIIGAPLVWLTTLQAGYILAYQACDAESRSWVVIPSAAAVAIVIAALGVAILATARARNADEPQPTLAWIGVGVAALMVVVMAASMIAPVLLRPCD